jgi:hypothetical protein
MPEFLVEQTKKQNTMRTYSEAFELALMSARNARYTSNKQTACERRSRQARRWEVPDVGTPPRGIEAAR